MPLFTNKELRGNNGFDGVHYDSFHHNYTE